MGRNKVIYKEDDGRTVYSMEGLNSFKKNQKDNTITKKEKRAMRRAMLQAMLPQILCIIAGFSLGFILLYLWLK